MYSSFLLKISLFYFVYSQMVERSRASLLHTREHATLRAVTRHDDDGGSGGDDDKRRSELCHGRNYFTPMIIFFFISFLSRYIVPFNHKYVFFVSSLNVETTSALHEKKKN